MKKLAFSGVEKHENQNFLPSHSKNNLNKNTVPISIQKKIKPKLYSIQHDKNFMVYSSSEKKFVPSYSKQILKIKIFSSYSNLKKN